MYYLNLRCDSICEDPHILIGDVNDARFNAYRTPYRTLFHANTYDGAVHLTEFVNRIWGKGFEKPNKGRWEFNFKSYPYVFKRWNSYSEYYEQVFVKLELFFDPVILLGHPDLFEKVKSITSYSHRWDFAKNQALEIYA